MWTGETAPETAGKAAPGDEQWSNHPKPLLQCKDEKHPLVEGMWSAHPQPVQLSEEEKHRQLAEQKDNIHTKIGTFEI